MAAPHFATIGIYQMTLCGILVTEESFLKGLRHYEKTQLEHRLVSAVCPQKLPTELFDHICKELDQQARQTVEEKWNACSNRNARLLKFGMGSGFSDHRGLSAIKFLGRSANATAVALSTPVSTAADPNSPTNYYIHLSTAGDHPNPLELAGEATAFHPIFPNTEGIFWGQSKSFVVGDQSQEPESPQVTTDTLTYLENPYNLPVSHADPHTQRLVQLGGIKEAIKTWDGGMIRKAVETLGFKIVPFNAERPFEPEVVQYQRVYE
ncbi:hypothetical protein BST61_g4154 [Cercospora zeina]